MGLFDGNVKKLLETSTQQISLLEQELENSKNSVQSLSSQLTTFENEKRSLELDKQELQLQIQTYKNLLSDDAGKIKNSKELLIELQQKIDTSKYELSAVIQELNETNENIAERKEEFIVMDEAVLLQSFGLYTPKYSFTNSSLYKDRLTEIRNLQAEMIKNGTAAVCLKIWSVEGSAIKGKKLTEDNVKQIIRTYNTECDNVVQSVKFSNYESSKKRILKSYEALNKLNLLNKIVIQKAYLELKYQELALAFEYSQKVTEEKEELKQQRELRKEELKLARELEEKRAEVEKEQQHYMNAMERLRQQIDCEKNEERLVVLKERETEVLQGLADVDVALKDLDYREANHRAGYVYVISNIGTFGENVYKIGMTRRLDPQERVDELGGASVPFRFDVHALIFSDDAPKLETALHKAFEYKKINAINGRKEFFRVTLEEIEEVVKANHDKSIDFVKYPEAQQYRESLRIRGII